MGFNVSSGVGEIGPEGLNAKTVDVFDIVTGSLHLKGLVEAKDISLIAGASHYQYVSGESSAGIRDGEVPEYALDSAVLGGIRASASGLSRMKVVSFLIRSGKGVSVAALIILEGNNMREAVIV
ncbi:MAG: hypothetical protein PSN37_00660 [Alphaproteobacteria bacterium]|nr:hypothetical protein [Alphaproteobacteria bacterium]